MLCHYCYRSCPSTAFFDVPQRVQNISTTCTCACSTNTLLVVVERPTQTPSCFCLNTCTDPFGGRLQLPHRKCKYNLKSMWRNALTLTKAKLMCNNHNQWYQRYDTHYSLLVKVPLNPNTFILKIDCTSSKYLTSRILSWFGCRAYEVYILKMLIAKASLFYYTKTCW